MSDTVPLIVTTLPGRTVREAQGQIRAALGAGADLAEVRFDRWDPEERRRAAELFPSPLPLLATLRSRAEGGSGPDDADERTGALERLAQLPFEGIDLEIARDRRTLDRLPAHRPPIRVLSQHLPADATIPEVTAVLRDPGAGGTVRKVVLPASVRTVLRDLLPALPPPGDGPRVLLTTGPSGNLLRAWSARLEFPLVYARLPSGVDPAPAEPSQIPSDRLRMFLDGGPAAPIFAILGHPVAHSQSPYLHSRWMRATGRPGLYIGLDIESESELVECLPALAGGGFRGINVTHPWKSVALAAASRVGRSAEVCGVANCLTFRDGEVEADNTDLAAVLRRLEEYRAEGRWNGRELAVIGAGGSAAATLAAARELGASASLVAREPDRAAPVAAAFGAALLTRAELRPFDLVVHATPVGRSDAGDLGVPIEPLLTSGSAVLDWVYVPDRPVLREAAARAGARYEDGWRMLVYQAAASFSIWWDAEPPREEIDATVREGPCAG